MRTYIAYVFKDPHSSFGVSFPDLPGCYGAGDSYEEALESAKISLREYALAMEEDGNDLPTPRLYTELQSDATEAIEFDRVAFVAEVHLVTMGSRKRVNLSIDDQVLAAIDRACALAGVNRSAFMAGAATAWMQDRMGAIFAPGKRTRNRKAKVAALA